MSAASWIKFAMVVGEGKPELAQLVEIAQCYEDTTSDSHKFSEKNLRKSHARGVANGYKNSDVGAFLKQKPKEHGEEASSGSTTVWSPWTKSSRARGSW